MHNDYYEAVLEGRFPFNLDSEELPNGRYKATYVGSNGDTVEVEDDSAHEAHRLCTSKVIEGIQNGTIVPFR